MTDISDSTLMLPVKLARFVRRVPFAGSGRAVHRGSSQIGELIIGRSITARQINALRHESSTSPDPDIIRGLTTHFGVPLEYLTSTGPQAQHLDKQLRLLASVRDAGVKHLALRGGLVDALDNVYEVIDKLLSPTQMSPEPNFPEGRVRNTIDRVKVMRAR